METNQLRTLAETFDESVNSERSFSIEHRESWLKGLSEFAEIIMEAAEDLNKRDAALDRISELAAGSYQQLAAHDKVAGAGRVLRSIMDIAAAWLKNSGACWCRCGRAFIKPANTRR